MRGQRGITLLELVVVMAIVALTLGLAVPSYRSWLQNQELRGATWRLASDLEYARHAAVDRSARVAVCPGNPTFGCREGSVWEDGWFVYGDDSGDRRWQPEEPVLRIAPGLDGISARSAEARGELSFFPNGTAPGSNATLRLCDDRGAAHGRQVRVSLSGRIRTTSARQDGADGC